MTTITYSYPVRRLRVDFDTRFVRYWYQGRPFETHWFNALSLGLPQAERYAISCIKQAQPLVRGTELEPLARAFIGQEATHNFVHGKCNAVLKEQGFDFVLDGYTQWRLRFAPWLATTTGLGITAAWEHFTAILCEYTLSGDGPAMEGCDEPVRSLWVWHCAEELEHKALAYDMFHAAGGGYVRLQACYLYGAMLFLSDFAMQTLHNMYRDRCLASPRVWGGALRYFFGRRGLFWFALPRWLAYFKPGFNPSQADHTSLVRRAFEQLDGNYSIVGADPA
ncbi:hypothetical protein GJ700_28675 [Duganella sp. FT92W]|uniref:Metal-dependent hydrolase n=1 Tax=Pseudoduganella rivuli TaxID=2666085 RepID=A0A7X2ITE5_9BURK|nr:metal-dependent hydrolase [Pseudoduganella rivuli]MRV75699.1 hypothetical protein [Pseudoduganella rivuli]